jgi:hypothetical protein
MTRPLPPAVFLACWLLSGLASAQQTFEINPRAMSEEGKTTAVKVTRTRTLSFRLLDAGGRTMQEGRREETLAEEFDETVERAGDYAPERLRRKYAAASRAFDGGKPETLPRAGRTVLIARPPGGVRKAAPAAEGEPALDEREAAELLAPFRRPDDIARRRRGDPADGLLPARGVKIGDAWPVSAEALADLLGEEFEASPSGAVGVLKPEVGGEAKLKEVSSRDGRRFVTVEAAGKTPVSAVKGLRFDPPAAAEVRVTLVVGPDGDTAARKVTVEVRLTGTAAMESAAAPAASPADPAGKPAPRPASAKLAVTLERREVFERSVER